MVVMGCYPFDHGTYLPQSDSQINKHGIRSLIKFDTARCRSYLFSALPPCSILSEASPKAISRRTSYYPTRLEFHHEPQLIRGRFNERRFGPPQGFTLASTWSWLDRRVSGLHQRTCALLRLAFASAPLLQLNLAR